MPCMVSRLQLGWLGRVRELWGVETWVHPQQLHRMVVCCCLYPVCWESCLPHRSCMRLLCQGPGGWVPVDRLQELPGAYHRKAASWAALATELHVQVAGGAAGAVVDQLSSIARLTPAGSQQLAADLEYLCNVLSALGVDIPQALAIWQVCKRCSAHAALQECVP